MTNSSLTYGQLEFLLSEMGYHKRPSAEPEWSLWENPKFNAVKIMPSSKQDQLARIEYFITIRKVSIDKGIVEPEEFEALLKKRRSTATLFRAKMQHDHNTSSVGEDARCLSIRGISA